ncbi:hypothetical protein COV24_02260 [candidate division WWE3 bacterium CG10_big_fil_rev_8_21_14_0_10_32_10]|uniref:Polymerase beta nucleotidyltransferase domain-containing protein n=1 Tax=candidate division WWE3 bacterium CG10_big_fil_rev_8_21_14_0_10_32_10 TaxID=1975090 RepID=A0A2H0RAG3_UNCKA|nr:MAG: hypothetical protein COV24_02260 [candidate division WWE3 bacterium CG10_big_fil_rev_8_21_14_0_10_32_10]
MNIKFISENLIKKQISNAVYKVVNRSDFDVFIFGSRVTGTNMERSDIDVGVMSKTGKKLSLSILSNIREELENIPTLYKFDTIDLNSVSHKFKKEALKKVEKL